MMVFASSIDTPSVSATCRSAFFLAVRSASLRMPAATASSSALVRVTFSSEAGGEGAGGEGVMTASPSEPWPVDPPRITGRIVPSDHTSQLPRRVRVSVSRASGDFGTGNLLGSHDPRLSVPVTAPLCAGLCQFATGEVGVVRIPGFDARRCSGLSYRGKVLWLGANPTTSGVAGALSDSELLPLGRPV